MFRKLMAIGMGVFTAINLMILMVGVAELIQGTAKDPGVSAAMVAFFTLLTGATSWGTLKLWRGSSAALKEGQERALLEAAMKAGGSLTLAQAAAHTKLSVADAKAVLERLSLHGVAEVDFAEDGSVLYRFKGLGGGASSASAASDEAQRRQAAARQSERT